MLVFDNLHLTPYTGGQAKAAAAAFLEKGVADGDQVTLIATGGGPWWTTTMPEGRADLLEILKGLDARRVPENATERMTDYEAMRIYVYHDTMVARRVQQRFEVLRDEVASGCRNHAGPAAGPGGGGDRSLHREPGLRDLPPHAAAQPGLAGRADADPEGACPRGPIARRSS